ncbi:hypothetical protein OE88DRAFT_1729951 [Heliocybe sulcata]|uniref:F-box domain-containing protein n=1 Tax=Heliocybe sulcata TaxID=5364 RepID=A0A5C3NGH5_9AGAM|nr:hypothetical protein OE88DRAFT_1729951 [Heliocybe sulcata]
MLNSDYLPLHRDGSTLSATTRHSIDLGTWDEGADNVSDATAMSAEKDQKLRGLLIPNALIRAEAAPVTVSMPDYSIGHHATYPTPSLETQTYVKPAGTTLHGDDTRVTMTILKDRNTLGRIPNELILMIWMHLQSLLRRYERENPKPLATLPFTLSWVSRHWRVLVFNTPSFWCDMYVGEETSKQLLKLQLERTRCNPLRIHAHIAQREQAMQAMKRLMSTMASRWESLDFVLLAHAKDETSSHSSRKKIKHASVAELSIPLPELRCSRMTKLSVTGETEFPEAFPLMKRGAAQLRDLTLGSVNIKKNLHLLTGLTSLTLKDGRFLPSPRRFSEALAACPDLTVLSITGSCVSVLDDTILQANRLRALEVSLRDSDGPEDLDFGSYFFSVLRAPNVEVFRMIDCSANALRCIVAELQKHTIFTDHLTKVVLGHSGDLKMADDCATHSVSVMSLCSVFPAMQELDLCSCWTSVIKGIREAHGPGIFAPEGGICVNLRTLTVRNSSHRWNRKGTNTVPLELEDELRALITGRKAGPFAIQELCVEPNVFLNFTTLARTWFRENIKLVLLN